MWNFKETEELSRPGYPIKIRDLVDYPQAIKPAVQWIDTERWFDDYNPVRDAAELRDNLPV